MKCKIDGCNREVYARGLCSHHYYGKYVLYIPFMKQFTAFCVGDDKELIQSTGFVKEIKNTILDRFIKNKKYRQKILSEV